MTPLSSLLRYSRSRRLGHWGAALAGLGLLVGLWGGQLVTIPNLQGGTSVEIPLALMVPMAASMVIGLRPTPARPTSKRSPHATCAPGGSCTVRPSSL